MFVIILLIMLLLFVGISYYLARHIHKGIKSFFPKVKFWPVQTVLAIIVLFLILGFAKSPIPLPDSFKHFTAILSSYFMGIIAYLLMFTVIADFIFFIPKIKKLKFTLHKFFNGFVTITVLSLTLIISVYGFVNAATIDHVSYNIKLNNKTDVSDIKIVLISDLHLGAISSEERLEDIVSEINSQKPDIVCIAGDFFDTDYTSIQDPNKAIKTLNKIKSTYGTYACLGNHDAGKTYNQMVEFLKKANVKLLNDEYEIIDNRLVLVGRMDKTPIGGIDDKERQDFSKIFDIKDSTLPVVVMDHNPKNINEYDNKVDLILCGHTHKGQIFPINIITNIIYDVDYGYYRKNNNSPNVIVTSGIVGWGMPMRVASDNEVVTITFNND